MNSLKPEEEKLKFQVLDSPPVITGLLVLLLFFVFLTAGRTDLSMFPDHSFKISAVIENLITRQWDKIFNTWLYGNFACLNVWQLVGSMYFLGVFGITVEKRLGPARYLLLAILASTIPWVVQYWDGGNATWSIFPGEQGSKLDIMYIGPFFITCAFMGAYIVMAPTKKRLFVSGMPKPRGEILQRKKLEDVGEVYGFSRWTFVGAFLFYALLMHTAMLYLWHGYDIGGTFAALVATLIGYGIASLLLRSAHETFKDSGMKLEAIRRYNELVDLDVTPEDAIKGSARAMGLPVDQVRLWVNQNKGRLRIT